MLIEGIVIGWPDLGIQWSFSDVVDDADDLPLSIWDSGRYRQIHNGSSLGKYFLAKV
jgi:hypothetical protein